MQTPQQKIYQTILMDAIARGLVKCEQDVTPENSDELYESLLDGEDDGYDLLSEFRSSGAETYLPCECSRHYETKAVAAKMYDGSWVGWTYFYGGGKHSEPDAIPWIDGAYFVNRAVETKTVEVATFSLCDSVQCA